VGAEATGEFVGLTVLVSVPESPHAITKSTVKLKINTDANNLILVPPAIFG